MNLEQANALRVKMGLPPMVKTAAEMAQKAAQKKRENANKAARAEENRRIRDVRNRNKK